MTNYKPLELAGVFGVFGALGVFGVFGALVYYDVNVTNRQAEVEIAKARIQYEARKQYELRDQDLNGDGTPERFYEVNGEKCFLEIDGTNLEDTLRE